MCDRLERDYKSTEGMIFGAVPTFDEVRPPLDSAATPLSIQRCRELLGADGNDLSDAEIEAIRDQTDALAHVLIDIYLDRQRQERPRQVDPVRYRFGRKIVLV